MKKGSGNSSSKLTKRQLECLVSPIRMDLYEAIQGLGRASAGELAQALGKSVHSLYYHLRKLELVQLVRIAEYQRVGKKDEAVYEPVSRRLIIDRDNADPAYRESLIKAVHLTLRKAEREHRQARQLELTNERFGMLRLQASLSAQDATRLREKLVELGNWIQRRSDPEQHAESIAITCLITPLEEQP